MRQPAILAGLFVIAFMRCATIDHGAVQRIQVDSDPLATVRTKHCGPGSTKVAETPGVVWVSRRAKRCTLTFTAPGFEPQTVRLARAVSKKTFDNVHFADLCDGEALDCWNTSDFFLALFLGGFLAGTGFGIDAATGAMFEQQPSHVDVELVEESPEEEN